MTVILGAWILTYMLHSTIVLGASYAITRALPRRQERWAEMIWRIALVGGVVSATVASMFPQARLALEMTWDVSRKTAPALEFAGTFFGEATPSLQSAGITVFVAVWLTVACTRLLSLLAGYCALRRTLARRIPIEAPRLLRLLHVGGRPVPSVSLSSAIGTPVVLGLNEVVLPFRAVHELTDDELDAVLAHEMAHLERRDTLWLWLTTIIERLFWIQPLNRAATTRLRTIAETLCDDAAVFRTASPEALATALTRVAGWLRSTPAIELSLGMATSESLAVARVRRILEPRPLPSSGPHALRGLVTGAVAMSMLIATVPRVRLQLLPIGVYTITAYDDAGRFTVSVDGSRVVGATLNDVAVAPHQIRQDGARVRIESDVPREALDLTLTTEGGLRWSSRAPLR